MIHFDEAGGVPIVMKRLKDLLDTKVTTATGTLEERLRKIKDEGRIDVIKSPESPYSSTGGIAVYKGNLARDGSVIKESGVDPSVP